MLQSLLQRQGGSNTSSSLTATNILSSIKVDMNIENGNDSDSSENDNLYEPSNLSEESENEKEYSSHLPMWNANAFMAPASKEDKECDNLFTVQDVGADNVNGQEVDFEKFDENDENDRNLLNTNPPSPTTIVRTPVRKRGDKSSKKRPKRTKLMKPPCKCTQNCLSKISEERRKAIHEQYWENCYAQRGILVKALIDVGPPKRKRSRTNSGNERRKTFSYHIPNESGQRIKVCQLFFLNTLGMSVKVIVNLFKDITSFGDLYSPSDKRGKVR